VLETEGRQGTDYCACAGPNVPETDPLDTWSILQIEKIHEVMLSYRRLFAFFIPHSRDQNKSWRNRRLEATQKHANSN